jgi:hypothetical protein
LPLVAAAVIAVPLPPWVVDEYYARGVYPWLQLTVTSLSNLVPVAVLDVMIAAAAALVAYRLVQFARGAWRNGLVAAAWEVARRTLRAAAVLVLVFFFAWGCHYRQTPLQRTIRATPVAPAIATLQLAVADANALGAALRPTLQPDVMTYPAAAAALATPMQEALAALKLPPLARLGRPKFSLILTPFFTWTGTDGMINPLALESIVHPDLLPVERPFVLAHEWAHLAGEADEAEASAVGWLACMKGGPALAYSASLYLIGEAGGALPPAARQEAFAGLADDVRADLQRIAERMRLQKPRVQRAAFQVYDQYLKANTVEDGTASYSRALTLILAPPLRDALNGYGKRAP